MAWGGVTSRVGVTGIGDSIVGEIAVEEQVVPDDDDTGGFNAMERGLDCCDCRNRPTENPG